MWISELNTKELTDPAYVAFDDGEDTYKTEFNECVENAANAAVAAADLTENEVAFTSGDAASPTAWSSVSVLTSGSTLATLFNRISTMIKNVRWLYSRLGTTDISSIGNGTVTGALSTLNGKTTAESFGSRVTANENANYKSFQKIGNCVVFAFQGENKARSESQLIFTIPSGFCPVANYYLNGFLGTVPCVFQLQTNGTCIIYTAASYPTARVYLNASYVCS